MSKLDDVLDALKVRLSAQRLLPRSRAFDHTFVIDITPRPSSTSTFLDGVDISGMLRSIEIKATVDGLPTVTLDTHASPTQLRAVLPEAQISAVGIINEEDMRRSLVDAHTYNNVPLTMTEDEQCRIASWLVERYRGGSNS